MDNSGGTPRKSLGPEVSSLDYFIKFNRINSIAADRRSKMQTLKINPTIKDFQKYASEMEKERGFTKETVIEKCLLLGEEVGELFKAVRKSEGVKVDNNSKFSTVENELADIFIYLCEVANRYQIDLEKAFREKEKINKKRIWKKNIK